MQLSVIEKILLRKYLEDQLKYVKYGQRIHIDKEVLEQLIFDTNEEQLNEAWESEYVGSHVLVKYIVWSGEFLSKIDLSEISFDDVFWNTQYCKEEYFCKNNGDDKKCYDNVAEINLSDTNAYIDFSKSINIKYGNKNGLELIGCNFMNTDLSNNSVDTGWFINCDLSNTGVNININNPDSIHFMNANLAKLDLSNTHVTEMYFSACKKPVFYNCSLVDTGLRIDINDGIDNYEFRQNLENLRNQMDLGYLYGCYVDDMEIKSKRRIKEKMVNTICNDIKKQITYVRK